MSNKKWKTGKKFVAFSEYLNFANENESQNEFNVYFIKIRSKLSM